MKRVLAVDDEPAWRDILAETLKKGGYDVMVAASGDEALDQMKQWQPNALVTDIVMPDMDGIELVRVVRRRYPNLPIVAISAGSFGWIEPLVSLMDAFGTPLLLKPFCPEHLTAAVELGLASGEGRKHNPPPQQHQNVAT